MKTRISVLFSLLVSFNALALTKPVVVVDDRKVSVEVQQPVKKVAAISVFAADLMQSMDMKVAGISTLNQQLPDFLTSGIEGAANLGEVHETNMDVLTELKPDLIVALRPYTEPFADKFSAIAPYLAFDFITYKDSLNAVEKTTATLGKAKQGKQLNAAFERQLEDYANKAPGGVSAIFLWHWADVPVAFYSHHLTTHLMERLGAKNTFGNSPTPDLKAPDGTQISMEQLLALDPDVVFSFKGEQGDFLAHPVWQQLKAVKNGRAWRVDDHYVMSHGPLARKLVLEEMAHLLYPETFNAPNSLPEAAKATPMKFKQ